jgi:4-amino-4-deoxy-L-arabinose transferase-like glycosyltransferase
VRAEEAALSRRRLWLGLLLFAYAFGLRAQFLGAHAFHNDEALYAGFSRRILGGDLLLTGGLNNDKPPLQAYLGAGSGLLFGTREGGLRLLNAALSAAECGLLGAALLPLAGLGAALLAGVLLASSPLGVGYGGALLMDGPMSLALLAACLAAGAGRAWLAGLLWALACGFKQTAGFLLPWPLLALALGPSREGRWRSFAAGALAGLLPVLVWSALFQHPRLGMILLMRANQPEVGFGAHGLAAEGWLDLARRGFAQPGLVNAVAALGLLALPWLAWRSRGEARLRPWLLAALAAPSLLGLFLLLGLRGFERYWLPALPFVAALPALGVAALPAGMLRRGAGALCLLGALAVAAQARQLDIHGTQGLGWERNDGFRELCQGLSAPIGGAPAVLAGTVGGLHWLGNWYLPHGWELHEAPDEAQVEALQAAASPTRPLYWAAPQGEGRIGTVWRTLPAPAGLSLQVYEGGRP